MWMPLYVGDYLGDTMALQMDEHGFYFLLLLYYWRKGPPPDDPDILRAITKCPARDFMRVCGAVKPFFTVQDGVWVHKRVEEELAKAQANKETAVAKGKAGAEARWGNATANAPANASTTTQASFGQCLADGPSPSPSSKEEREGAKAPPRPLEIEVWNSHQNLPRCLAWNGSRLHRLKVRRSDPFFEANYSEAVKRVAASSFCTGGNDRGWKATFDWMLQPDTVAKIMEGKYDNREPKTNTPKNPRNIGVARAGVDYGEAAKRLQEKQRLARQAEEQQRLVRQVAEAATASPTA